MDNKEKKIYPHLSKNWCQYKGCVYNQNGYCITGPELEFTGQFTSKGKPIVVCVASYSK